MKASQTAHGVRVAVPLPGSATYRNGSFVRDGRPLLDDAAEEFFGTGTMLEEIPPKSRVTFLWKIGVKLGNKPLVIAPLVSAEDSALIGAQPLIVSRKAGAQTGFAAEVQRAELPIYELDDEEQIEHEAADAALGAVTPEAEYRPPMEPPLQPTPPPDQPGEPIPPPGQPATDPEPGIPVPEPTIPGPPEEPPAIEPTAREAVVLYGRVDRPSVAYFENIFNGNRPPTLLNHFILGGALACTRALGGGDVAGLKAHMDAQAQLLQRVVLHEKLGKKEPIAEYAGTMLARVDQFKPGAGNAAARRISERAAARSRTRSADAGGLTRDAGREREVGFHQRRGNSRSRFKRAGSPQARRPNESRKRSEHCATMRKRPQPSCSVSSYACGSIGPQGCSLRPTRSWITRRERSSRRSSHYSRAVRSIGRARQGARPAASRRSISAQPSSAQAAAIVPRPLRDTGRCATSGCTE